jgi:hypothetical protein
LNLVESSRQLGALRAVELECFRRLGGRAARLEPASCARWAASASLAHAWRASLIEELLPVSAGLPPPEELTVLPTGTLGDELARALPEIESVPAPGVGRRDDGWQLVTELAGRLYPRLVEEYTRRLEKCSPAADGAVARTMRRAVADLESVRADGVALVSPRGQTDRTV